MRLKKTERVECVELFNLSPGPQSLFYSFDYIRAMFEKSIAEQGRLSYKSIIMSFAALQLVFFIVLTQIEKGDMVLFFNARYNDFSNTFFKYFTVLGDGVVFIPIVLFCIFYHIRSAVTLTVTGGLLGLFTNLLKLAFIDSYRPRKYFDGIVDLNFVEGVEIHGHFSFPSGHTATAAALAIWMALHFRTKSSVALGLAYITLIGISRVYLAQHFFVDVAFGMLEGVLVCGFCFYMIMRYLSFIPFMEGRLTLKGKLVQ